MASVWTVLAIEMVAVLAAAIVVTRLVHRGVARRRESEHETPRAAQRRHLVTPRRVRATTSRAPHERVRA